VSLGWYDLRRTVRRRGPDAPAQAYPFLLRDERLYPQLGLAVDYFESMVGRPRAELDGEVLVQFFADHRLARGVVASLAGHYRYRRQGFGDALDAAARLRLGEQGIYTPGDLRAALYDEVNQHDGGFAADASRTAAMGRLAVRLDLAPEAVEALLVLDAEDRAPLVRVAAPPTPAEVAAIYNHLVADAVLRAAARVDLELAAGPGRHRGRGPGNSSAFVRSLHGHAALAGLRAEHVADARADRVALLGEQDALGSWTRHGRRLVRALGRALSRHPGAVRGGSILVQARGGPYCCAITPEFLSAFLGSSSERPPAGVASGSAGEAASPDTGADEDTNGERFLDPRPELALLRRRGEAVGWSLRNWPMALVYPEGVLFPEFALLGPHGPVHVVLADTPALAATIVRLAARLAIRQDVLLVTTPSTAPPLADAVAPRVALAGPPTSPAAEGEAPQGPLAAVLAAAATLKAAPAPARATPLDHLLQAVREAGFLPPDQALALAGCADEAELAGRLAAAGVEDVRLVPGVGLHTESFLEQLHGASRRRGAA
jgi:hypothetical protein